MMFKMKCMSLNAYIRKGKMYWINGKSPSYEARERSTKLAQSN